MNSLNVNADDHIMNPVTSKPTFVQEIKCDQHVHPHNIIKLHRTSMNLKLSIEEVSSIC